MQNKRTQFLHKLYEATGGNVLLSESMYQIGEELCFDRSLTEQIVQYLVDEGYIEYREFGDDMGARIGIRHEGVLKVEESYMADAGGKPRRTLRQLILSVHAVVIAALVILIYPLGYIIWALHAYLNHLGFLPTLHSRYVVAGIVPTIIVAAAYFGGRALKHFLLDFWPGFIGSSKKLARVLRTVIVFIHSASFLMLFLVILFGWILKRIAPTSTETIRTISMFTWVGTSIFHPRAGRFQRFWNWVWVSYGAVSFAILGLALYIFSVYPNLPQAFGGVKQYCVHLDIIKEKLSREIVKEIVYDSEIQSNEEVVKTKPLDMYFDDMNFVLVKLHGAKRNIEPYKISSTIITNRMGCSQLKNDGEDQTISPKNK